MSTATDYRTLPLADECDVLVIDGGAAGVCAAVAAARSGARTVLLERNLFLGGRATASMVLVLDDYTDGQQITVKGLATEYAERLKAVQSAVDIPPAAWTPENRGHPSRWTTTSGHRRASPTTSCPSPDRSRTPSRSTPRRTSGSPRRCSWRPG